LTKQKPLLYLQPLPY